MRRPVVPMAMLGVLLAAVPAPSLAAASDSPTVIRTCDASGLPEADRGAALVHPCRSPLGSHELSLRLVRLAPTGTGASHVTLGYSLVDTQVRFGSLATVYVDRVADLAVASRIDLPTLLGRAIAHEIGHLLPGTAAHARAGVMRAVRSPEALRRDSAGDWRFTPRDAEALRDAARRRAPQPLHTW